MSDATVIVHHEVVMTLRGHRVRLLGRSDGRWSMQLVDATGNVFDQGEFSSKDFQFAVSSLRPRGVRVECALCGTLIVTHRSKSKQVTCEEMFPVRQVCPDCPDRYFCTNVGWRRTVVAPGSWICARHSRDRGIDDLVLCDLHKHIREARGRRIR